MRRIQAFLINCILLVTCLLPLGALCFAEEGETAGAESNPPYRDGDVNEDGQVTAADAALAMRAAKGMVSLESSQAYAADVTTDMSVDDTDAMAILLYADGRAQDFTGMGAMLTGELLGSRYADRFSYQGPVRTENSYRSAMVNVTSSVVRVGRTTCYVADILIRDISCFRTAFGKGEINAGRETTFTMAKKNGAIIAVNGDSVSTKKAAGPIVRNGHVYVSSTDKKNDMAVLYRDGRLVTYAGGTSFHQMQEAGEIYQSWDFGPMLLDAKGHAVERFASSRGIAGENPRTAIGYYEPGHYVFVVVDGRQKYSKGLTLAELSVFFEELGCVSAYNMDGGQTSVMATADHVVNQPYEKGRSTTDILYICEPGITGAAEGAVK